MSGSASILKEIYWVGILFIASYLIISLNSSFNPFDSFLLCERGNVYFKNIAVILQLTILLTFVRFIFNMTAKIENQKMKYFLYPIVLFALPVSIILVWLQYLGC